jgi:hypothetical protein
VATKSITGGGTLGVPIFHQDPWRSKVLQGNLKGYEVHLRSLLEGKYHRCFRSNAVEGAPAVLVEGLGPIPALFGMFSKVLSDLLPGDNAIPTGHAIDFGVMVDRVVFFDSPNNFMSPTPAPRRGEFVEIEALGIHVFVKFHREIEGLGSQTAPNQSDLERRFAFPELSIEIDPLPVLAGIVFVAKGIDAGEDAQMDPSVYQFLLSMLFQERENSFDPGGFVAMDSGGEAYSLDR